MKFLTRIACTDCGGTGRNTSAAYQALRKWQSESVRTLEDLHHKRIELGVSYEGTHTNCSTCGGRGEIEQWQDFSEILTRLTSHP